MLSGYRRVCTLHRSLSTQRCDVACQSVRRAQELWHEEAIHVHGEISLLGTSVSCLVCSSSILKDTLLDEC